MPNNFGGRGNGPVSRERGGQVDIITNIRPRPGLLHRGPGLFICDALGVSRDDAIRMTCEKTGMKPVMVNLALASDSRLYAPLKRSFYESVLELCRQKRGKKA